MQWWGREKRILSFLIAEIVHVRAQRQLTHPAFYHTSESTKCQREYKRDYLIRSRHLLFIMCFLHLQSFCSLQLCTIPVQTQIKQQTEEL